MDKLQQLPIQHRAASVKVDGYDPEKRTVTFALSSEQPVERWYGKEILDHSESSIDSTRLKRGIPLLFNHDRNQQIGRIESYQIKDRKLYVTARFGNSALAKEKEQDVRDGILVDASAGYIPMEYKSEGEANGDEETLRWMKWTPAEGSLCPIPADPTVGVGRDLPEGTPVFAVRSLDGLATKKEEVAQVVVETAKAEEPKERGMTPEEQKAAADAGSAEAVKLERERVREIEALHVKYPEQLTREQSDKFINDGTSLNEVRGHVLGAKQVDAKRDHVPTMEITVDEREKVGKGIRLARCVRAFAARKGDLREAAKFAQETYNDPIAARALSASSAVGGGFLIAENMSSDLIEFLRPQAVVRSLNPTEVPLVNGALSIPKMTSGTSAQYIGENQNLPVTGATFGMVRLVAKKLAAIIPISNDLIRYQSLSSDSIVRDDLAAAIAQREDLAFIRDAGTNYTPKGLRFQVAAANVQASIALPGNPTGDLQAVIKSLSSQKLALRKANVPFRRFGRIMSPRTEYYLQNLLTVNGVYAFKDDMAQGKLLGDPYRVTTQIPENLVDGTQTEIYAADFADVIIGQVPTMVMEVSSEATYWDGAALQSAFSLDQTVIKCIMEHDLGVRRQESLHVLTGVTWS